MDLYAVLLYSVLASVVIAATGLGNPLGLLLVFFVPGYLGMAALLPRKDDGDGVLRLGLTLGLSIALVAFVGIALNYTPWGVGLSSVLVSLLLVTWLLGAIALRRRVRVPPEERLEMSLDLRRPRWNDYTAGEQILAVALVLILVVTVPLLGVAVSQPRATQPFTELYLLGPSGNFTGYPTRLNVSQPGEVQVVVVNHEGATRSYGLRVDLVAVVLVYNATQGKETTVELNRTTLQTFAPTVVDEGSWTQPFTFAIGSSGTWEVQFLLTMAGSTQNPYREVHLLVTVP